MRLSLHLTKGHIVGSHITAHMLLDPHSKMDILYMVCPFVSRLACYRIVGRVCSCCVFLQQNVSSYQYDLESEGRSACADPDGYTEGLDTPPPVGKSHVKDVI